MQADGLMVDQRSFRAEKGSTEAARKMMHPHPHRLPAWALRRLSPPRHREEVLGDLNESYGPYFQHYGRRGADRVSFNFPLSVAILFL